MAIDPRKAYDGIAKNYGAVSVDERQFSPIIHLRQFNNWIKSSLIDHYCPPNNASIFDCACGKGGDIPKFKLKNPNQYVLADISAASLDVAYYKYFRIKKETKAYFIAGDTFSCDLSLIIPSDLRFHISSCQFAFHYSFKTEELARSAVSNLCDRLLPGGFVLLTIPNACRLVKLFRENPDSQIVQNSLVKITRNFDLDDIPMFGAEYVFDLCESVDNTAEYLVHPEVLKQLFKQHHCELVESFPFHEYYHEVLHSDPAMAKLFCDLLVKLGFENADMTPDEWFVVGLYSFFVFRKDGEMPPMPPPLRHGDIKSKKFFVYDAETGEKIEHDISPYLIEKKRKEEQFNQKNRRNDRK